MEKEDRKSDHLLFFSKFELHIGSYDMIWHHSERKRFFFFVFGRLYRVGVLSRWFKAYTCCGNNGMRGIAYFKIYFMVFAQATTVLLQLAISRIAAISWWLNFGRLLYSFVFLYVAERQNEKYKIKFKQWHHQYIAAARMLLVKGMPSKSWHKTWPFFENRSIVEGVFLQWSEKFTVLD